MGFVIQTCIFATQIGGLSQNCQLLEVMKALVVWWLLEHIVRVQSRLEIALASSGLVTFVDSVSYYDSLFSALFTIYISGVKCVIKDTSRVGLHCDAFILSNLMHLLACLMSFAKTHGFRLDGTFQEYVV